MANVTPGKNLATSIELTGLKDLEVTNSEIITASKINSYNDYGNEEEVNITKFNGIEKDGNSIKVNIPSKTIMLITLKQ